MPKRIYRITRQQALRGIIEKTGYERYRDYGIDLIEARYETLKRLSNDEFAQIRKRNLRGERVDDVVDEFVVTKTGGKLGVEIRESLSAEVARMSARFSLQELAHRALRCDILLEFLRSASVEQVAALHSRCQHEAGCEEKLVEMIDDLYDTLPSMRGYDTEITSANS